MAVLSHLFSILCLCRDDAPPFAPAAVAKPAATHTKAAPSEQHLSNGKTTKQKVSSRDPEGGKGDEVDQALQQAAEDFAFRHPKSAAQHEKATQVRVLVVGCQH